MQDDVVAFLMDPATHGGAHPIHIETHLSHLFLAGQRAFKLKKAVLWSVVDYATLERREHFCRKEIDVNAHFAADLYVGLRRVTQQGGTLSLDGPGKVVDWLVEMHRFDDGAQLDMMVDGGTITAPLIEQTGDSIARMHRTAPIVRVKDRTASRRGLIDQLEHDVLAQTQDARVRADVALWARQCTEELRRRQSLVDARARHGFVRRCHGDLHLSNICVWKGDPTPFDAIEFSDEIATIDVLYDLAFVLIDLEQRGRKDLSARLLSRYMEWTRDYAGLALLPIFMSLRAMVRALVGATKGRDPAPSVTCALRANNARPRPWLLAIGGLSGSGKSTVARAVCERSGAVVIRSDTTRKHLLGVRPEDPLPVSAYATSVSCEVYRRLLVDAKRALRAGWPVILDATFMGSGVRARAEAIAEGTGAQFCGVWLEVPLGTMVERVAQRRGDASDADPRVVRQQSTKALGAITWQSLDGTAQAQVTAERIAHALEKR